MYDDTSVEPNCNKEFHGSETYVYIQHMCEPPTHSGHSQQVGKNEGTPGKTGRKLLIHVLTLMW